MTNDGRRTAIHVAATRAERHNWDVFGGTSSRRFSKATLVLPAFLALGMVLPDRLLNLVCRSGAVMDVETCCPSVDGPSVDGPSSGSQGDHALRNEACCSLRAVDLDRAIAEGPGQPRAGAPDILANFVVLRADLWAPSRTEARSLRRPVAPLPLGPPLLLVKSAFLL